MTNGRKTLPEDGIQLPETKVAAETGTMSGPLVSGMPDREFRRKADVIHVVIRVVCLMSSVTALSLMVTTKEGASISIYGFSLPVFSKWSFSDSFEYLVGVSAAVAVHSVLQLLISVSRLLRKCSVVPSRSHAWLIFAGDQFQMLHCERVTNGFCSQRVPSLLVDNPGEFQYADAIHLIVFAYAMMSAGSAASGVSNLNRTGIRHSALPNFCKPLHNFCDRVAISIAFTFLGCFLLATSAILDVVWLSKY
ncbi:hypothetical protein LguiA_028696 [Lonicera macranthoides]